MKNLVGLASVVCLAAVLAGCQPPPPPEPPDLSAEAEAAVRELIDRWSAAAAAKDPDGFASVYAADGVLMLEDSPDFRGADAIREAATGMMQDPAFALSFAADEVVASRSGDLAYELGTYTMTMSAEDGQPTTETGHYVVVWSRQDDGTWKVVVDAPLSDPPAGAPAS